MKKSITLRNNANRSSVHEKLYLNLNKYWASTYVSFIVKHWWSKRCSIGTIRNTQGKQNVNPKWKRFKIPREKQHLQEWLQLSWHLAQHDWLVWWRKILWYYAPIYFALSIYVNSLNTSAKCHKFHVKKLELKKGVYFTYSRLSRQTGTRIHLALKPEPAMACA